ncbi:MAG: hypothetical protein ACREO0_15090 [Pseudoxanthomonas sp.]
MSKCPHCGHEPEPRGYCWGSWDAAGVWHPEPNVVLDRAEQLAVNVLRGHCDEKGRKL